MRGHRTWKEVRDVREVGVSEVPLGYKEVQGEPWATKSFEVNPGLQRGPK